MADHQNRHQTLLSLHLTLMQQGITRTALMEQTLGISVTRSQRISLPNLQVSVGYCHSRTSGIGKSETTVFHQLDLHEGKKICRTQTLRKYQTFTAASIMPKIWLSLTTSVKNNRHAIYLRRKSCVTLGKSMKNPEHKKVRLVTKSRLFKTMASMEKQKCFE